MESITAFAFFNCPECVYRSKEEYSFQDHAVLNHPLSQTFFNDLFIPEEENLEHENPQISIKSEPDQPDGELCESKVAVKEEEDDKDDYLDEDDDHLLDDVKDEESATDTETKAVRKTRKKRKCLQEKKEVELKEELCCICYTQFPSSSLKYDHVESEHVNSEGLIKCEECDETAQDYDTMMEHMLSSHRRRKTKLMHQCPHCQKIFPKRLRLMKHIESVHEKRKANCPHCNKELQYHALRNHIKYSHQSDRSNKSFKCDECDFSTHLPQFLKNHVRLKHRRDEFRFPCDKCEKKYAFESQLKKHKQVVHDGLKPFMCHKCGKSFGIDGKAQFEKHIQSDCKSTIFPEGRKCHSCEVLFTVEGNYIKHHIKVHGSLPPTCTDREMFMCDQCSTLCISKKALKTHISNTHNRKPVPKKRHKCPYCEKTFAVKLACDEHVKVKHENSTPFKCDQCHRCYGTLYAMKQHKFSMHQRVKCEECGQEVSNTLILTRHKAKAHGIRPANVFQCKHCPLFYTLESQLEKHVLNHHLHQFD